MRTKVTNLDIESPGESAGKAFITDGSGEVIISGVPFLGHHHVESQITDIVHDAVKLRTRDISTTAPTDGQTYRWDSGASEWVPSGVIATDEKVGEVQEEGTSKATAVSILNFKGTGVNQITDVGGGKVDIDLTASGSGATEFTGLIDTPSNYTGHGGKSVLVNLGETALEFTEVGSAVEVLDEGNSLTTNVTSLDFVGDSITATAVGSAVTISGGVASADFTMWMPDAPPPSGYLFVGTEDDEFDDSSFDTGIWSEFDVPDTQIVTEADYGLYLTTTTVNNMQGIYQPVPNGQSDWSFTTYVGPTHGQTGDQKPGILLIQDIGDLSNTDCYLWVNFRGGAGYGWQAIFHTSYNTHSSDDFNSVSDGRPAGMFLRFRLSGTTWHFDWSEDGYHWVNDRYTRTERFTIQGIGIGQRVGVPSNWHAPFKFARFLNSSDKDQMLGARVRGWHA